MVYSPEPKALARTEVTGDFARFRSGLTGWVGGRNEGPVGRAQKANRFSMSLGFQSRLPEISATASAGMNVNRVGGWWLGVSPAMALALCCVSSTGLAHAQSAGGWDKRGAKAELREDFDEAYEDFKHAREKSPKDLRYKAHLERMRFAAAAQHVDRGRVLRQSGDFSGALTNFLRAAEIDPANQTAQQEIVITQHEQPVPAPSGPGAVAAMEQVAQQNQVLNSIASITGPVELKPVNQDPVTYHAVEDVKVLYQAIGKTAGLNVLFDPEYTSKRIPLDLTAVSLQDALRILGTISGTFYKAVTPNTIFVAQNTRTKRTDLDELAVQTFYLANSSQANDGNEVLTGLRLLLDPSAKLYLVPSQNAIVVRATTDELLLAQKLINDFDRARPEVVVDVAVLEVNRDKVRNLGITLPQSFGLTPQLPSTTATSTSSTTTTTTPTTSTSGLTLNNFAHLNATNFAVTVTGGTLNALLTDTDTRILQNPRIRATDGQRATLKIGSKIPIATGSYNSGVTTGTASIGVQTQFQYIDVGVNIDLTPTVHYDREVSLKLSIEVSSQSGTVVLSNVSEPIISQRKVDQVIQVQDGEPSILAGILTHQDNKTVSGTPGLGELPFFKYFFSTQSKETQQDELVFLIIPHIVRESVLTTLNTRAFDTGTGASIDLRRDDTPESRAQITQPIPSDRRPLSSSAPITAGAAATAAVQEMHQQALPPTPPVNQVPLQVPASAALPGTTGTLVNPSAPISLTVVPTTANQAVGSTFQAAVMLQNGTDVYSVPLQVQYDPKVLQLVNVDAGDFLARGGQAVSLVHRDEGNGLATISSSRPPNAPGVTGQGSVCTLTFKAIGPGDSNIALVKVGAKNSSQASLPAVGSQAVVHVK